MLFETLVLRGFLSFGRESAEIDRWRQHGGLGRLWMSGHRGGTRW